MKVFIHLGIHKTASTFLQTNIFTSLKSTKFLDRKEMKEFKNYVLYIDDFDFCKEKARNIFNKTVDKYAAFDSFLISDEEFYGNPYIGVIDRKRNIDRLIEIFKEDLRFLIFIRNQVKLMLSLYSYYVKTGGTSNIKNFMGYKKYPLNVNDAFFKYDAYLEYIKEILSDNKLKMVLYEDFVFSQQKTVEEILDFLNESSLQIKISDERTNKSLNYSLLNIVRFINRFIKSPKQPFLFFPIKTHFLARKIFETFEFSDTRSKNKLLKSIKENTEFMNNVKDSNDNLIKVFEDINIQEYDYPIN